MIFGVDTQLQFFSDSDVRLSKKSSPPIAISCSFRTFPDIFTHCLANSRITPAIFKSAYHNSVTLLAIWSTLDVNHCNAEGSSLTHCPRRRCLCRRPSQVCHTILLFATAMRISKFFCIPFACSSKRAKAVVKAVVNSVDPKTLFSLLLDIDWERELKSFAPLKVSSHIIHVFIQL